MGVAAVLQGTEGLAVEPGQTATCQLNLGNTGTIVEQYTILLLGDAAEWTQSDPPVVSLFPGAQQTVTLKFSPPRVWTTPAGPVPFAVKVIPSNEPEESVTEEGVINVGTFSDIGAELLPRVATARLSGRQKLAVDSRGNVALPVAVTAVDAADALQFKIRPPKVTAAPGAAHFVRMRIKPRKRFWKGQPQQKPYKVQVQPEHGEPLVLDGSLTQKPILPKWAWVAAALALAAVLAWYFLLRPIVKSTAQNANKAALAAQAQKTAALSKQVQSNQNQIAANQAQIAANQNALASLGKKPKVVVVAKAKAPPKTTTTTTVPKKGAAPVTTTTSVPTTTTTATTLPPPVTGPADGSLEVVAAPGSTSVSSTPPVAAGSTVTITDIVIQNISGATGTARISRATPKADPVQLLVENLANMTNPPDQEFSFNTPIILTHDQTLQLRVDCAGAQSGCDVAIYFTGPLTQPQSDTTTTIP
jgi:hypothetical protein